MFQHSVLKHRSHHTHPDGKAFAWLSLFIAIGNASFWTIFPLILRGMLRDAGIVGLYYGMLAIITLCASIASSVLFTRFSKVHIMHVAMVISILALIAMSSVEKIFHIAGFDIPRAVCVLLFAMCLSLFVYDFSKRAELASEQARLYLFSNIGWFVGPITAGITAKYFGNQSVFF